MLSPFSIIDIWVWLFPASIWILWLSPDKNWPNFSLIWIFLFYLAKLFIWFWGAYLDCLNCKKAQYFNVADQVYGHLAFGKTNMCPWVVCHHWLDFGFRFVLIYCPNGFRFVLLHQVWGAPISLHKSFTSISFLSLSSAKWLVLLWVMKLSA